MRQETGRVAICTGRQPSLHMNCVQRRVVKILYRV
jgi:hypothetical protein